MSANGIKKYPFSSNFVPKKKEERFADSTSDNSTEDLKVIRLYLASLYQPIAEKFQLRYTQDEIDLIERKTRQQSSSLLWYRFRAGRVTGSVFKFVCRTSVATPAMGTIEKICFPERNIFESKATAYGKRNESVALDEFFNAMSAAHDNYQMRTTGLIINNKYPFCGVSPDAIVSCDCCGDGVVEVKCPYLMRFGEVKPYLKKTDSPLIVVDNATGWEYNLTVEHEYYYQVQMEMYLTEVDYCDFVVWNPKHIITVRVKKNEDFWNEKYEKATEFFKKVLLPELYACYFSRKKKQPKF